MCALVGDMIMRRRICASLVVLFPRSLAALNVPIRDGIERDVGAKCVGRMARKAGNRSWGRFGEDVCIRRRGVAGSESSTSLRHGRRCGQER